MGKRKITASIEEQSAAEPTTTTPALLAVETPDSATAPSTATAEPATSIETPAIELPKPTAPSIELAPAKAEPAAPAPIAAAIAAPAAESHFRQYALLAASLTIAVALGAVAGAAVTFGLAPAAPPPAAKAAVEQEALALKNSVAQLGRELVSLRTSLDTINRHTATQFKGFAERFDRAEKAQAEPAAKIAKIIEALDRLERRTAAAPTPAAAPAPAAPAAAPDVTGAVTTVEKHQSKPPTLEGWKLVDMYAGRVILASRAGQIYEVGPGSNLPGVGKIEKIKREDGRIVVVTPNGIITAAIEQPQPRRPHYSPYRYY